MKQGRISENILKRSVMTQLHSRHRDVNAGICVLNDCAEISVNGGMLCTSSINSTELSESFLQGDICICRAVNNIAVSGAEPSAVLLSLTVPENTEEPLLREMISSADKQCGKCSVQISGCDIRTSKAVNVPIMTVSGIGISNAASSGKAMPGDDIVMTKWAAVSGTAVIAATMSEILKDRFAPSFISTAVDFDELFSVAPEAAVAAKSGFSLMHDASEGGVFGALWEMAERSGVGLQIDMKEIPVRQETIEICNYLNISPYELMADGSLLIACRSGHKLMRELLEAGINAAVIGTVTEGNDRCLLNGEEKRFLEPAREDEIYKIKKRG